MEPTQLNPSPTLRLVERTDEAFLLALFRTGPIAHLCECAIPPGPQREALILMQFRAQDSHYLAAYGPEASFVVEVDGEPVGRIFFTEDEGDIHVADINLLPQWRGRGIGAQLFRDLQERARRNGRSVSLAVEHYNPDARRLYERLGFLPEGEPDPVRQAMVWRPPAAGAGTFDGVPGPG
jgi:ribosomal protein S18 acetylase RimI-like enzyme